MQAIAVFTTVFLILLGGNTVFAFLYKKLYSAKGAEIIFWGAVIVIWMAALVVTWNHYGSFIDNTVKS